MEHFAQIRIEKITSYAQLDRAEVHNCRLHEERGYDVPGHIHSEEEGRVGEYYHASDNWKNKESYREALEEVFEENGVKPRKNSVLALEYCLSMSADFWEASKKSYSSDAVLMKQLEFITKRHGSENIIATSMHFDESSPHIHVIVAPMKKKYLKRYDKVMNRLCARDFTDGPATISKMQRDFFDHCNDFTSNRLGIELTMYTPIDEQIKDYSDKVNHDLGAIRNNISKLNTLINEIDLANEKAEKKLKAYQAKLAEQKELLKQGEKEVPKQMAKFDKMKKDIKYHNSNKTEAHKKLWKKETKKKKGPSL